MISCEERLVVDDVEGNVTPRGAGVSPLAAEAVEVCRVGSGDGPVLFTCEHATARLPEPWQWPLSDHWLREAHWAFDPGAAELSRELCAEFRTVAVLSRFSRLLADPNRPLDAPDLCRSVAEGRRVDLNAVIDAADRARRVALWTAYHATLDREVAASHAEIVFSVHTFTPIYEGIARGVEVGVLFDEETELAERLRAGLADEFRVEMNEPYSGRDGLMYSVDRHARKHGRRGIELEFRQDLAVDASARARLVACVARTLARG